MTLLFSLSLSLSVLLSLALLLAAATAFYVWESHKWMYRLYYISYRIVSYHKWIEQWIYGKYEVKLKRQIVHAYRDCMSFLWLTYQQWSPFFFTQLVLLLMFAQFWWAREKKNWRKTIKKAQQHIHPIDRCELSEWASKQTDNGCARSHTHKIRCAFARIKDRMINSRTSCEKSREKKTDENKQRSHCDIER